MIVSALLGLFALIIAPSSACVEFTMLAEPSASIVQSLRFRDNDNQAVCSQAVFRPEDKNIATLKCVPGVAASISFRDDRYAQIRYAYPTGPESTMTSANFHVTYERPTTVQPDGSKTTMPMPPGVTTYKTEGLWMPCWKGSKVDDGK